MEFTAPETTLAVVTPPILAASTASLELTRAGLIAAPIGVTN
jgi:hypothetical protein